MRELLLVVFCFGFMLTFLGGVRMFGLHYYDKPFSFMGLLILMLVCYTLAFFTLIGGAQ